MVRSFSVLLAALALVLGAAPRGLADGAAPAAPAADKKTELSPAGKNVLAQVRALSAEQRKKKFADMDAMIENPPGGAPKSFVPLLVGMRAKLGEIGDTVDAIEAAKAAKDNTKAAALETRLVEQANACGEFHAKTWEKIQAEQLAEAERAKNRTLAKVPAVGEAAPAVAAKIVSGEAVSLKFADHPGKPVVVEFWATWCAPCRASIPHLDALWEKYKDKAVFVSVSNEDDELVKKFVAKQKAMRYPVAVDEGETAMAYGVTGIPLAFIVVDGKVAWNGHPSGLEQALEAALGEKKDEKKAGEESKK